MEQLYWIYTPGCPNAVEVMWKPSEYAHAQNIINDAVTKQHKSCILHVRDKNGYGWTLNAMNIAIQERFKGQCA